MVLEAGGGKLKKISFEDISSALKDSKPLRGSVLRLLASEYGDELSKHVDVVPKVQKPKKK
jgi:hypothetical protein